MDFLDPRRRRHTNIKLLVGYVLTGLAIALGTIVLVYGAYGYSLNTKTGDVVQNGLLFVDSKPAGASIYLNGKSSNATSSARMVLPAGDYDLKLQRSGYRDWQRKFTLEEHTIARYVYPFLFPNKPVATTIKVYPAQPSLITQSPDRHWLLVSSSSINPTVASFDEYDTSQLKQPPKSVSIPAGLLTNSEAGVGTLTEVEWSTDNKHILLQHNYTGGYEFIIFNRDEPAASLNINRLFNLNPSQVALRNKKIDQLYIYNQAEKTLQLADVGKKAVEPPILRHVLAFKSYGNNLINYVTDNQAPTGQVIARIWDKDKSYPLYTFSAGTKYIIDTAEFQGHSYFIAGSDTSNRINLYKDPLSRLRNPAIAKAVPIRALVAPGASKGLFSNNTRFVAIQGGQNFAVYDLEVQKSYKYVLSEPVDTPLHWMDGHRFIGHTKGSVFVMDYDSTNQQLLGSTTAPMGGFFSGDYNQLYVTTPISGGNSAALERLDMRAGSDLPKNP